MYMSCDRMCVYETCVYVVHKLVYVCVYLVCIYKETVVPVCSQVLQCHAWWTRES